MKGGAKVVVEPHRHEGVFIARGKEDALCTLNSAPGKVDFLLLLASHTLAHSNVMPPRCANNPRFHACTDVLHRKELILL